MKIGLYNYIELDLSDNLGQLIGRSPEISPTILEKEIIIMIAVFTAMAATIILFWLGRILMPDEPLLVAGGALFLGLIIRRFVDKKWRKRHKQTKSLDIFPNLRLNALEQWGAQMGQKYKDLKKIVLFDPPLKYPLDVNYILYFDFDTTTSEGKISEKDFNEINAFQINAILDNGFQGVYRNKLDPDFRDEWFLTIVKYSGFDDEYSWVIYQKDNGLNHINSDEFNE